MKRLMAVFMVGIMLAGGIFLVSCQKQQAPKEEQTVTEPAAPVEPAAPAEPTAPEAGGEKKTKTGGY